MTLGFASHLDLSIDSTVSLSRCSPHLLLLMLLKVFRLGLWSCLLHREGGISSCHLWKVHLSCTPTTTSHLWCIFKKSNEWADLFRTYLNEKLFGRLKQKNFASDAQNTYFGVWSKIFLLQTPKSFKWFAIIVVVGGGVKTHYNSNKTRHLIGQRCCRLVCTKCKIRFDAFACCLFAMFVVCLHNTLKAFIVCLPWGSQHLKIENADLFFLIILTYQTLDEAEERIWLVLYFVPSSSEEEWKHTAIQKGIYYPTEQL